jgi:hypothetical protein
MFLHQQGTCYWVCGGKENDTLLLADSLVTAHVQREAKGEMPLGWQATNSVPTSVGLRVSCPRTRCNGWPPTPYFDGYLENDRTMPFSMPIRSVTNWPDTTWKEMWFGLGLHQALFSVGLGRTIFPSLNLPEFETSQWVCVTANVAHIHTYLLHQHHAV